MNKKFLAFTLAEILVALTIIGVVAALTISNVMINTNAVHARTALKKAIANLNQAILTNSAEDGFDCAETIGTGEQSLYSIIETRLNGRNSNTWQIYANFIKAPASVSQLDKVATPEISNSEIVYPNSTTDSRYYTLQDGMTIIMPANMASCGSPRLLNNNGIPTMFTANANSTCIAFLDINGAKGPNQVVGCESAPSGSEANDYILPSPGAPVTCRVRDKSVTDVYPILFYNDRVYPATYAAMTVYMDATAQN